MTEEVKLTAWTCTAMVMEIENGVELIKDIGEQLGRYAFLALPGTLVTKKESNKNANVRLLNYNILRDICHGEIKGMKAEKWIDVFVAAKVGVDTSGSRVLPKIQHVPLRLRTDIT